MGEHFMPSSTRPRAKIGYQQNALECLNEGSSSSDGHCYPVSYNILKNKSISSSATRLSSSDPLHLRQKLNVAIMDGLFLLNRIWTNTTRTESRHICETMCEPRQNCYRHAIAVPENRSLLQKSSPNAGTPHPKVFFATALKLLVFSLALTRIQAQTRCSCSPLVYTWVLDFSQPCNTSSFPSGPGTPFAAQIACDIDNDNDDNPSGSTVPVNVTGIRILELDENFENVIGKKIERDLDLLDGDLITYESKTLASPSVVSGGLQVGLDGRNAAGETVSLSWIAKFSNECNLPAFKDRDVLGWTVFMDLEQAKQSACFPPTTGPTLLTSSPMPVVTISPTIIPTMRPTIIETVEPTGTTPAPAITIEPTVVETNAPSSIPTVKPSIQESLESSVPTNEPTITDSRTPAPAQTEKPEQPTITASNKPTSITEPPTSQPRTRMPVSEDTASLTPNLSPTSMSMAYSLVDSFLEERDDADWLVVALEVNAIEYRKEQNKKSAPQPHCTDAAFVAESPKDVPSQQVHFTVELLISGLCLDNKDNDMMLLENTLLVYHNDVLKCAACDDDIEYNTVRIVRVIEPEKCMKGTTTVRYNIGGICKKSCPIFALPYETSGHKVVAPGPKMGCELTLASALKLAGRESILSVTVATDERLDCSTKRHCRGKDGACCGVLGCDCPQVSTSLCKVFNCAPTQCCEEHALICGKEQCKANVADASNSRHKSKAGKTFMSKVEKGNTNKPTDAKTSKNHKYHHRKMMEFEIFGKPNF